MVFAGQVDGLVVRHDQMSAFADLDSAGADVDALAIEIVHFLDQHRRVDHHAVADQAGLALQDTGGHQVADELFTIDDHRVSCIVAALKTDDKICTRSQKIDDFTLALVTPLRSDDNGVRQISLLRELLVVGWLLYFATNKIPLTTNSNVKRQPGPKDAISGWTQPV